MTELVCAHRSPKSLADRPQVIGKDGVFFITNRTRWDKGIGDRVYCGFEPPFGEVIDPDTQKAIGQFPAAIGEIVEIQRDSCMCRVLISYGALKAGDLVKMGDEIEKERMMRDE